MAGPDGLGLGGGPGRRIMEPGPLDRSWLGASESLEELPGEDIVGRGKAGRRVAGHGRKCGQRRQGRRRRERRQRLELSSRRRVAELGGSVDPGHVGDLRSAIRALASA